VNTFLSKLFTISSFDNGSFSSDENPPAYDGRRPSLPVIPTCDPVREHPRRNSTGSVRRQGIFWIATVPAPSAVVTKILEDGLAHSGLVWFCGQLERGDRTGYEHYQFVCAFGQKVSINRLQDLFGTGCHFELSKSKAANDYCCKEETRIEGPWDLGIKPFCRNSKEDWQLVWLAAQRGDMDAIPAHTRIVSYHALRAIASDYDVPKGMERTVFVFWGATGTGKSRRAWDEAGVDAYPKDPKSKFWCGYRSHKEVVIDEFRGGIDVAHLLRWFDRYPVRVEVKGSSRPLNAERIWITSNLEPKNWYPDLDVATLEALMRRLKVTHFNESFFP